jgi:hypothetical protein
MWIVSNASDRGDARPDLANEHDHFQQAGFDAVLLEYPPAC